MSTGPPRRGVPSQAQLATATTAALLLFLPLYLFLCFRLVAVGGVAVLPGSGGSR